MYVCPVCQWPLNTAQELKTHMEIKHPKRTKRFAHVQALVELRDTIDTYPDPKDAVHDAIVSALPKQYRAIYAWIISHGGKDITTSFVAAGWRIAPNHAGTILLELYEFGLLERELIIDNSGKRYQYHVKAA